MAPDHSNRSTPPWAWRLLVGGIVALLRRVRGWRVRVVRPEVLPAADRPLVGVFNHTSAIDGFVIADTLWRVTGHWARPLVKAEVFDVPVLGALARRAGGIAVHRSEGAGRELAYDDAVAQLADGGLVLIAPEGTITHDGSLLPLRTGAARLALEAGVDVLVVTQFGSQRAFSPVARFPERRGVVMLALDLLTPLPGEDATALTGRIAVTMLDRSAELRQRYPEQRTDAPWWPPYSAPAPPSATARQSIERYQESMTAAIEQARERMAALAAEHDLDERFSDARERATATASELTSRSRERASNLAEQARDRTEQARERASEVGEQLGEAARELADQARERLPGGEPDGPDGPDGPDEPGGSDGPDPHA